MGNKKPHDLRDDVYAPHTTVTDAGKFGDRQKPTSTDPSGDGSKKDGTEPVMPIDLSVIKRPT